MAEQNILFICEGLEDEPGFIKKLMSVSYPSLKYRVYSYKTTIHTLASKLDHDYPDFNSGEVAWREWKRTAVRFATDNSARRGGQRCALRRPVPATDEKQPQVRRITLFLR